MQNLIFRRTFLLPLALLALTAAARPVHAEEPGRGLTEQFEINYLRFIINHHFSALRMTELAAGTQQTAPTAEISPEAGTSPTPNLPPTEAKADLDELKSLARRTNRAQREEILEAQGLLLEIYGIDHQPRISPTNQSRIDILEQARAGSNFDISFMEVFSRHHFTAAARSGKCLVASDIGHVDLRTYCQGIVNAQVIEINSMRGLLCEVYGICDYQPLVGLKGEHTGDLAAD